MEKTHIAFMLLICFVSTAGKCSRIAKSGGKKLPKIGRHVTTQSTKIAVLGASVYLVTDELLSKSFEEAKYKNQPIHASFYNTTKPNINIRLSLDGKRWSEENIGLGDKLEVTSGGPGIIAIAKGEKEYTIEASEDYTIEEDKDGNGLKFNTSQMRY